jgi:hypothetical protein
MKKKFVVFANEDALKYQVINSETLKVQFEHDEEDEAKKECSLMNENAELERTYE